MATDVAAVVVAAGRGSRAGDGGPKQYRQLAGESVICTALRAFCHHPDVGRVQSVIHPDDMTLFAQAVAGLDLPQPVFGGATRQDSVHAGLEALTPHKPKIVLVHDAARPFVSSALITRAITAASATGAAVPGLPIVDGVKTVDALGRIAATVGRDALRTVQTPQAFNYATLLEAHRRAQREGHHDFIDDAAVVEWTGTPVSVFEGDRGNVKLTTEDDFVGAERAHSDRLSDVRTGTGFDVHAFGEGGDLILGGIRIPHARALAGHSDADVVLHALTDALLGALAEGDIGLHFPPTDERWRGASSGRFLAFAADRVRARGGRIALLDVTVLCESPRIGPHRDAMRERIGTITGVSPARVAVKATTTERLGFLGRGEGIAALATATIRLPGDGDD